MLDNKEQEIQEMEEAGGQSEKTPQALRPNSEVLDEIEKTTLSLIDEYENLPSWMKFVREPTEKDLQEKEIRRQEEIKLLDFTDDTLTSIKTRGFDTLNLIDDELRTWAKRIVLTVKRTRVLQGLEPYTEDALVMLSHEIWHADHKFTSEGHLRDNDDPYARTHLFNACLNAILDAGITSLKSLIAILCHDDEEDLKTLHWDISDIKNPIFEPKPEKLLCDHLYRPLFKDPESIEFLQYLLPIVHQRVLGVTKVKEKTISKQEEDERNYMRMLEAILEYGTHVDLIRLTEREHNIDTLETHAKPERRPVIASTTAHVHSRTARAIGVQRVHNRLLGGCYDFLNPTAREKFIELQEKKFDAIFGVNHREISNLRDKLYELLNENPNVVFSNEAERKLYASVIEFLEHDHLSLVGTDLGKSPLGNILTKSPIEDIMIRPEKFEKYADPNEINNSEYVPLIDAWNPLFKIVIHAPNMLYADNIKKKVVEKFDLSNIESGEDRFSKWVKIYDPKLAKEAIFTFVITTRQAEALQKRGEIPLGKEGVPLTLSEPIKRIMRKTRESVKGVFDLAEKEFQPVSIQTPELDWKNLPHGATSIDYAYMISSDLLSHMKYAECRKGGVFGQTVKKNIYEQLTSRDMVKIVENKDSFEVRPHHRCFAILSGSIEKIQELLNKRSTEELYQFGCEFIEQLKRVFNFSSTDEFLSCLTKVISDDLQTLHNKKKALEYRRNEVNSKISQEENKDPTIVLFKEEIKAKKVLFGEKMKNTPKEEKQIISKDIFELERQLNEYKSVSHELKLLNIERDAILKDISSVEQRISQENEKEEFTHLNKEEQNQAFGFEKVSQKKVSHQEYLRVLTEKQIRAIGDAKINPLLILGEIAKFDKGLEVQVTVPNITGIGAKLLEEFSKDGHNLNGLVQDKGKNLLNLEESTVSMTIQPNPPVIDMHDILKTILRMRLMGYDIRIVNKFSSGSFSEKLQKIAKDIGKVKLF